MRNPIIEKLLAKSRRTDIPKFGPGDTIKVQVKIREGEKERLQAFEGVVIARAAARNRALRSAKSVSARAWSVFSPSTPR
jgi:ribosomal protein L19